MMIKKQVRIVAVLFALLWLGVPCFATADPDSSDFSKPHVPGEVLVRFEPGVSAQDVTNIAQDQDLELVKKHRLNGQTEIYQFKVKDGEGALQGRIEDGLMADPDVKYAEPNYIVHVDATPNDPNYSTLWGLHNTGQSGGTAGADIHAAEAWDVTTGNPAIIVAVIDTGVDYNHPDLAANMWKNPGEIPGNGIDDDGDGYVDDVYGYDFANNDVDPMDDNSHGTHCAGTIGAVGNNAVGVVGVNWNVKIMALKFLSASGSGTTSAAINCIQFGINKKAKIMSNSWGGGGYSQALNDAIAAANNAGILFVAAAGNNSANNDSTPFYPANYAQPNLISVAATDRNDLLASFSNYGATTVHLGAPGVSILSTTPGNTYGSKSGTSMATPHVSGAAALVWGQNPSLTAAQVKANLLAAVNPIPALQGKTITGGRLNVFNALQKETTPPAAITNLAVTGSSLFSVTLQWTATGDDGNIGTATRYDIRYSTSAITAANFAQATAVGNPPAPKAPGSAESFAVSGLNPGTTYYFAVKAVDDAGNAGAISNVVSQATTAGFLVFKDDVEGASAVWTASGGSLWHITQHRAVSVSHSWYYGQESVWSYDTGATNSGTITSPPISLAGLSDATLDFSHFLATENNASYDKAVLSISTDGGNTYQTLLTKTGTANQFANESINLNAYLGNVIRLRFSFDTVDAQMNNYEGWYVDDVKIWTTSPDTTPPAAVGNLAAQWVTLPNTGGQKFPASAVESSGALSQDYTHVNLTDGNTATFWSSPGSASQQVYFVLDMGSAQTIAKLRMMPRDYFPNLFFPVDFKIQVSADKVNWTTAQTVTGYQAQANVWGEWTFTPVNGRYVRISVDKLGGVYPYNGLYYCQISEAEVYPQGSPGGPALQLNWTAVGDDANTGTATTYDLRYSTANITAANFAGATPIQNIPAPKVAGSAEMFQVTGLAPGKYYLAMKVADEAGNISSLSNVVYISNVDETAPAAVTTLTASVVNLPGGSGQKVGGSAIESSGSLSGEYTYVNLTDGNTATFWSSPGSASQQVYFVLDMGSAQTIAKLRMMPRDYFPNLFFPVDFKIQVSADKVNWTTAQTVTGYQAQANVWGEWSFTPASGRYVRVSVDKLGGIYPYNNLYYCQISEVEVYQQGSSGGQAIQLNWTAVGDDANTGTATSYDLRYSTAAITAANFASATSISNVPAPKAVGSAETFQVNSLPAGTYYFAMMVADEAGNVSGLSNVVTATLGGGGGDQTAPSAVTTLAATVVNLPGGGGQKLSATGIESSGDLTSEYSVAKIADGDLGTFWSSSGTGSQQKYFMLDLGSAQSVAKFRMLPRDYMPNLFSPVDFRIQVSADKMNWTTVTTVTGYQGQANVWGEWTFTAASGRYVRMLVDKLGGVYPYNGLYYCQISEVEVYPQGGSGGQAIKLDWTAVGDDANTGTATTYDIRYSTATITAANFASATAVLNVPAPKASGSAETFQVNGLPVGTYYFAMKVADEAGNVSGLSNVASAIKTLEAGSAVSGQSVAQTVQDLHAENMGSQSAALAWSAPGMAVQFFDVRYSTSAITEQNYSQLSANRFSPRDSAAQTAFIEGLKPDTIYYFSLKFMTAPGQLSALSNTAQAATVVSSGSDAGMASGSNPPYQGPKVDVVVFVKQPAAPYPTSLEGLLNSLYHFDDSGMFPTGGNLFQLSPVSSTGEVNPLTEFNGASVRDPHAAKDGTKILFSMKENAGAKWQIFEVGADGSGVKKISQDSSVNDVEPVYLPDGRIGFTSDRAKAADATDVKVNLFAMNADGSGAGLLTSDSAAVDFAPRVDDQGNVFFSRFMPVAAVPSETATETPAVPAKLPIKVSLYKWNPADNTVAAAYSFDTNSGGDSAYIGVTHVPGQDLVSYFGAAFSGAAANLAGLPFDISPLEAPLVYPDAQPAVYWSPAVVGNDQLVVSRAAMPTFDAATPFVSVDFNLSLFNVNTHEAMPLASTPDSWEWMPTRLQVPESSTN